MNLLTIIVFVLVFGSGCAVNTNGLPGLVRIDHAENQHAYRTRLTAWGVHISTHAVDRGISVGYTQRVYIDHPSHLPFGRYNEIQQPLRKCRLVAYEQLRDLLGFSSYDELTEAHKLWVEDSLKSRRRTREGKWTDSIAVGRERFVEDVRAELGICCKERKIAQGEDVYELREAEAVYRCISELENEDIAYIWRPLDFIGIFDCFSISNSTKSSKLGYEVRNVCITPENAYFWEDYLTISDG